MARGPDSSCPAPLSRAGGFTYLGVLFAVALLGLALSGAGTMWSLSAQREREQQLLWTGLQFKHAIANYYLRGSSGVRQFPKSLDELVEDRRGPVMQRHLRRIYADPITGLADWDLLREADGGIRGVHSRSTRQPLKRRNFPKEAALMEDASCYCDWRFEFRPPALPARSVTH